MISKIEYPSGRRLFSVTVGVIVVFWIMLLLFSASQVDNAASSEAIADSSEMQAANVDAANDFVKRREKVLGEESFAFMAIVQDVQTGNTKKITLKSTMKTRRGRDREGKIPPFDIELGGHDLEDVAKHFGFKLALATDSLILGKVIKGKLLPMVVAELNRFSVRAREAYGLRNYQQLLDQATEDLLLDDGKARLIFLVPKSVEAYFIERQLQAIDRHFRGREIGLVTGRYTPAFAVEVTRIESKDGKLVWESH